MVDLQRPIAASGILFVAGRKTTGKIAIRSLFGVKFRTKILSEDSWREFYSFKFNAD
jgi:hypothetical protein